jgi:hypothetical protein
MMIWPLMLLSFAAKQAQLYGLSYSMIVSVALQFIYIAKFYVWEPGYMNSLDIIYDRAGFYLCWGCFVWVPAIYTSPTLYMVKHPIWFGKCCGWHYYKFEIHYESPSDHHGVVVRCAAKDLGIAGNSKGSVSPRM